MGAKDTAAVTPAAGAKPARGANSKVLTVAASVLASALAPIKPNVPEKLPYIVLLESNARKRMLRIAKARHGEFAVTVPAKGSLPPEIQVDGKMLGRIAASDPGDTMIELAAIGEHLEIKAGSLRSQLRRIALTAAKVKTKPMPVNRKHKGKVEPRVEGRHIRQRGQTWGFSANVPFKADRRDGDQEDE